MALCSLCLCASNAFASQADEPRRYNAGVTAYHSNDFARAAAMFASAAASRDRGLQQRSFYNLGNTEYRLGQTQPAQARQLWERALKNYETALALDPNDPDAKFNHDFVKKKLDELNKQQQEQQQQQTQQQEQKQEQQKNEQKQQQEQDRQPQQNSQGTQSDQPKQPQSQQSTEQQKAPQEQKDQQQGQQAQQEKPAPPEQRSPETGGVPENFDKLQAAALLNDLRENERTWSFFPEVQMNDLKDSGEAARDW
jgi:Ca-activated chloride channel family protein